MLRCKANNLERESGATETHHIIPRCRGGDNSPDNLVVLTLREHYVAHWMLWRAYPEDQALAFALYQMSNKNAQKYEGKVKTIPSRVYSSLKSQCVQAISENNRVWVYVKDSDNNLVKLSKQEYQESELKFHTSGMVYCYDVIEEEYTYITSDLYQSSDRYVRRVDHVTRLWINEDTGEVRRMSFIERRELNRELGYDGWKYLYAQKTSVYNENGDKISIPLNTYKENRGNYTHINHGSFVVLDQVTKTHIKVTHDEYASDPDRYLTSTKGKVLSRDDEGNVVLVSKDEFDKGNLEGLTKNMTSAKNIKTGLYEKITVEEFEKNKDLYSGPCLGKVNARNKLTGEVKQIPREYFLNHRDEWAGASHGVFKIRNRLTGETMRVTIWDDLSEYDTNEWYTTSKKYRIQ
jgi:hypothetical protein